MADLSKTAANDALERLKARIKGIQGRAAEEGRHLEDTIVMGVSGTLLGGIDNKWGRSLVMNFDNSYIAAGVGLLTAMSGVGGERVTRVARNVGNMGVVVSGYRFGWNMAGAMERRRAEAGDEGAGEAGAEGGGGAEDIRGT